jgi:hypothetical protein
MNRLADKTAIPHLRATGKGSLTAIDGGHTAR